MVYALFKHLHVESSTQKPHQGHPLQDQGEGPIWVTVSTAQEQLCITLVLLLKNAILATMYLKISSVCLLLKDVITLYLFPLSINCGELPPTHAAHSLLSNMDRVMCCVIRLGLQSTNRFFLLLFYT